MNPVRVQQIGHEITRSWFMKPFQGLILYVLETEGTPTSTSRGTLGYVV